MTAEGRWRLSPRNQGSGGLRDEPMSPELICKINRPRRRRSGSAGQVGGQRFRCEQRFGENQGQQCAARQADCRLAAGLSGAGRLPGCWGSRAITADSLLGKAENLGHRCSRLPEHISVSISPSPSPGAQQEVVQGRQVMGQGAGGAVLRACSGRRPPAP